MHALYVAHATDLGMPDASSCRAALGRCTRLTRLTNRLRQLGTYLGDIITLKNTKVGKKKVLHVPKYSLPTCVLGLSEIGAGSRYLPIIHSTYMYTYEQESLQNL